MRIIFRGKTLISNIWIYGDLVQSKSGKCYIKYGESKGATILEVHSDTIGQYSGLDDKRNLPIFTGDIINLGRLQKLEVKFENGAFCIGGEPLGLEFNDISNMESPRKTDMKYCEIIGNII